MNLAIEFSARELQLIKLGLSKLDSPHINEATNLIIKICLIQDKFEPINESIESLSGSDYKSLLANQGE